MFIVCFKSQLGLFRCRSLFSRKSKDEGTASNSSSSCCSSSGNTTTATQSNSGASGWRLFNRASAATCTAPSGGVTQSSETSQAEPVTASNHSTAAASADLSPTRTANSSSHVFTCDVGTSSAMTSSTPIHDGCAVKKKDIDVTSTTALILEHRPS